MSKYSIFRHGCKFKTRSQISNADAHNKRTIETHNADPNREFKRIYGADNALNELDRLLAEHNIKPRKNAVLANEYLLTFSPEMACKVDVDEWAKKSLEFLKKEHPTGLLAVDLHLDESTPHIQAIVAPFIKKKVRGKEQMRLSGKDFWGGKDKLQARITRYANEMKEFGLERGVKGAKAHHKTIKTYYAEINNKVTEAMKHADKELDSMENVSFFGFSKAANRVKKKLKEMFKRLSAATGRIDDLTERNKRLQSEISYLNQRLHNDGTNKLESALEKAQERIEHLEEYSMSTNEKLAERESFIEKQKNYIDKQATKIRQLERNQGLNR
jgi:hypothetical protein